jgi:hypothetical protein
VVIFFRNKSILAVIFLAALCLLVHLHFFVTSAHVVINADDGLLSVLLVKYIQPLPETALFLIYTTLVILQAIRLNMVLNEFKMFQQSAFTTAMAYIMLSACLPQWCAITPALVANSFLVWIFIKLSKLYNHPSPKTLLFNTGLIVGITVMSYHPTALLVLVVLFTLAVVRPFRLAEWLILLIGIVTPYYFLLSGLFLTDKMNLLPRFTPELQINLPVHYMDLWLWINSGVLFLSLFFGINQWLPANNRMVIQVRKNWGAMVVMLLILLPVPFMFKKAGLESIFLITVPLAAFISNAYLNPKHLWLPNLLFWITMVVIVHNNWVLIKI